MYCVIVHADTTHDHQGMHQAEDEIQERARLLRRTVTRPASQPLSESGPRRIQPRSTGSFLVAGLFDIGLHLDAARPPQEPVTIVDRIFVIRDTFTVKTHL